MKFPGATKGWMWLLGGLFWGCSGGHFSPASHDSTPLPPLERGEAWSSSSSSSVCFYLDVEKSLREADRGNGLCPTWDLGVEVGRLGKHLKQFEREMGVSLEPFSVHLFPKGKGAWAKYLAQKKALAVSWVATEKGIRSQGIALPVNRFGVNIFDLRHELGHVLIRQMRLHGGLAQIPHWLEEAFCEVHAASEWRPFPGYQFRAVQKIQRSLLRRNLRGRKGRGGLSQALSPRECLEWMKETFVRPLFYQYLLRDRTSRGRKGQKASPLQNLKWLAASIKRKKTSALVSEFRRFLETFDLGRDLIELRIEFFASWVSGGPIPVWQVEFLLSEDEGGLWAFDLQRLKKLLGAIEERDSDRGEANRFSLRFLLFQAWWKTRLEKGRDLSIAWGKRQSRLKRLDELLLRLKEKGLGPKEREELKRELGPLFVMVFPFGVHGMDLFQCHEKLQKVLKKKEQEENEVLRMICGVYPPVFPVRGLIGWSDPYPKPMMNWLRGHLPSFEGKTFIFPRFSLIKASGCFSFFRINWGMRGWLYPVSELLNRYHIQLPYQPFVR